MPVSALLQRILAHRAQGLLARLRPHLFSGGRWLDLGSGTGHNAVALARALRADVVPVDVADLHTSGPAPMLYGGRALPFPDDAFDGAMLLFVLHYLPDPLLTLRELRRVTRRRVLLMQSTWRHAPARRLLAAREWALGRGGFALARALRCLPAAPCRMQPLRFMTRTELLRLCASAQLRAAKIVPSRGDRIGLSRDLLVLEPA